MLKTNFRNPFKISVLLLASSLALFVLLLRNPYSTRTLIPNLEPFPDAMYYTTPPRCFLQGLGWKMCRLYNPEIEGITPAVPPAYSLVLLPGYLLNLDVRTFYFVNVVLSLFSLFLLYKISKNFFNNSFISGAILFLYVTNYFTYWYPTLAMAENLLQPLFLLSVLVLQQKKLTLKISFLVGILSVSFYATKYAFAPLTVFFPLIYIIKIFKEQKEIRERLKHIIFLAVPAGVILLNLVGLKQLVSVLNQVFNGAFDSNSSETIKSGGSYFSKSYFLKHFSEYTNALLGKSQSFLWDTTPLTERWVALPGILGFLISLKNKKYFLAKIWLIVAVVSQLLFISTFYVVDIRYVYHFLPVLLLGFGFFLQHLNKTILKKNLNFHIFLLVLLVIYLAGNILRLKSAVMINLKYSETPWWYLSQLEMNNYFDNLEKTNKKPILITLSAPFLTDNYSNLDYTTLPMNNEQDFHGSFEKVWGPNDYSNLIELYKQKINEGYRVYITNYGVSAAGHFQQSYKEIEANFNLNEAQTGCYNLCNVYQLELTE